MLRPIPLHFLLSSLLILTGCGGPTRPSFPPQLTDENSLGVSILFEGVLPDNVKLHSGYVSKNDSCKYTPRAFGIIAQNEPVPPTAVVFLDVHKSNNPLEYTSLVPLPKVDECDWHIRKIEPIVSVEGIDGVVFSPSMSAIGPAYLEGGSITYYCNYKTLSSLNGQRLISCRLRSEGVEQIKIQIKISK